MGVGAAGGVFTTILTMVVVTLVVPFSTDTTADCSTGCGLSIGATASPSGSNSCAFDFFGVTALSLGANRCAASVDGDAVGATMGTTGSASCRRGSGTVVSTYGALCRAGGSTFNVTTAAVDFAPAAARTATAMARPNLCFMCYASGPTGMANIRDSLTSLPCFSNAGCISISRAGRGLTRGISADPMAISGATSGACMNSGGGAMACALATSATNSVSGRLGGCRVISGVGRNLAFERSAIRMGCRNAAATLAVNASCGMALSGGCCSRTNGRRATAFTVRFLSTTLRSGGFCGTGGIIIACGTSMGRGTGLGATLSGASNLICNGSTRAGFRPNGGSPSMFACNVGIIGISNGGAAAGLTSTRFRVCMNRGSRTNSVGESRGNRIVGATLLISNGGMITGAGTSNITAFILRNAAAAFGFSTARACCTGRAGTPTNCGLGDSFFAISVSAGGRCAFINGAIRNRAGGIIPGCPMAIPSANNVNAVVFCINNTTLVTYTNILLFILGEGGTTGWLVRCPCLGVYSVYGFRKVQRHVPILFARRPREQVLSIRLVGLCICARDFLCGGMICGL